MKLRPGIIPKLTLVFFMFAAALVISISALYYRNARSALQAANVSGLLSTALEKQTALNTWVEERQHEVTALAVSPNLRDDIASLVAAEPETAAAREAHEHAVADLLPYTQPQGVLLEVMILDPETGEVLVSTDPAQEGKFKEDQPYFINGRRGSFVQNVYYAIPLQAPAMTASTPIRSENGQLLAVLAARLDLEEMNTVMAQHTGLHRSDEAFLVNSSNLFATQPRLMTDPAVLQRGVHTEAVNRCLERSSGVISALDYRGVPALIVYRWLPERQLCLIMKMDEAEAIAPANELRAIMLALGGVILIMASLLAYGLAISITRPIRALQEGAIRFGQGDLDYPIAVQGADEIGQLACELTGMANALAEKEKLLSGHAAQLEQLVADRTASLRKAQQVAHLGSWVWHIPENRLEWSDEMYYIFGVDRETFSGDLPEVIARAIHPQDRAAVEQANLSVIQKKQLVPLEYRVVWPDGSVRTVWAEAGELLLDEAGQPVMLTGVVQDITERKQAQEALAASHKRFESLIEHAPDGIALLGLDGMLRQVTPSTRQILGYTLEESIGQDPGSMTHPDDLPDLLLLLNDLVQNPGQVGRIQYRFRHKDGSWRWLDSTISNLVSEPSVQAIVFNYRDITEQKQAEEALRRSEERYRGIFDAAPVSIWLEDWTEVITAVRDLRSQGVIDFHQYYADHPEFVQGALQQVRILDVNDETLAMFKAKAKEEMLASLGVVFATDDTLPGFVGELIALGEGERIYRTEMALRTVQGDLIHVLLTMTFPAEESHSGEVLVSLIDITERIQALEALREADQRAIKEYERLLDRLNTLAQAIGTARDMPAVVRQLLEFAQASAPCNGLFVSRYHAERQERTCIYAWSEGEEYDPSTLPVMPMTDSPHSRAVRTGEIIVTDNLIEILNTQPHVDLGMESDPSLPDSSIAVPMSVRGQVIGGFEVQSTRKSAYRQEHVTAMRMAATLAAISMENVELLADLQGLNLDLEGRVAQRTLQLESANQELQAFAYSVSHDLRAPLRSIDGFSQALLRKFSGQLGTEGDHYLSRVRENTQRMGQLIDDMLALSRVSRQEMSRQPVDLMALAREMAKSLTESDAARKVTFKIADQGLVQGDPGLLRVMMQNLFENAWKFTARRDRAEVEVGLLPHPSLPSTSGRGDGGEGTVYFVRDNGAGFDMQYAGKLFGAFQRLHSPKEYPGTGIGLATVQRVIHRHGGRVWAEAAVNEGATFYFTLGEQS